MHGPADVDPSVYIRATPSPHLLPSLSNRAIRSNSINISQPTFKHPVNNQQHTIQKCLSLLFLPPRTSSLSPTSSSVRSLSSSPTSGSSRPTPPPVSSTPSPATPSSAATPPSPNSGTAGSSAPPSTQPQNPATSHNSKAICPSSAATRTPSSTAVITVGSRRCTRPPLQGTPKLFGISCSMVPTPAFRIRRATLHCILRRSLGTTRPRLCCFIRARM